METLEVEKKDWLEFLNEFSKQHQGEFATLEIVGADIGAQWDGQPRPFVGISVGKSGTAAESVFVMLESEHDDDVEHRINGAEHLWVKTTKDGKRDAIEVEAADGTRTILALQPVPVLT